MQRTASCSRPASPLLLLGKCCKHQARMRIGSARAHLCRDPDRLHQLVRGRPCPQRRSGVPLDAVRALGHVRDGDCDDLLVFRRKRAVRKDRFPQSVERCLLLGREATAWIGKLPDRFRIHAHRRLRSVGVQARLPEWLKAAAQPGVPAQLSLRSAMTPSRVSIAAAAACSAARFERPSPSAGLQSATSTATRNSGS